MRVFLCFTHLLHFCYELTNHDPALRLSLAEADPALIMAASCAVDRYQEGKLIAFLALFGLRGFDRRLRLSLWCAVMLLRIESVGISRRCCPLRNEGSKRTHFGYSRSVLAIGLDFTALLTVQDSTNPNVFPLQIRATITSKT